MAAVYTVEPMAVFSGTDNADATGRFVRIGTVFISVMLKYIGPDKYGYIL